MSNIKNKFSQIRLCSRPKRQAGFTLIELMIVIAIIGVVSAIAFPSYTSYMKKSRRAEVKIAITKMADAEERWYLQNSTYTTTVTNVGGADTEYGNYTLSVAAGAGGLLNGYIITAVADSDGAQADDSKCKTFIWDSTGVKTSKDSGGAASTKCW